MKRISLIICVLLLNNFVRGQVNNSNKIICSEKEQKIQGNPEPRLIKTCTWSNYKCISTGESDYKGRYFWSYKWFKLVNGKFIKIDKSELFTGNSNSLLEAVNKEIKNKFDELSKDSENKECLSEIQGLPYYNMDNLEIFLDKDGFTFSYSLGLSMACLAIDGDFISFTVNKVEPYLKK